MKVSVKLKIEIKWEWSTFISTNDYEQNDYKHNETNILKCIFQEIHEINAYTFHKE